MSAPRIAELRPASDREWDEAFEGCDSATFFHSREWAEVWCASTRGRIRPEPLFVGFDDGVRALLPLSVERAPGVARTLSGPAGTFGGWLAGTGLDKRHAALLTQLLLERPDELRWRVNPFDPLARDAAPPEAREEHTRALLLDADFETLRRRMSKGHRAALRQAERAGVEIERARDRQSWREHYELYECSLRRWGRRATSRHPWDLFEALRTRAPSRAELWLARREGEALAGALVLHGGGCAAYWHGAARDDGFPHRPVHRLVAAAIADACERGIAVFDMGPSGPHAGVEAFKKSFGAEALPCPMLRRARPAWPRRLWCRLTEGLR